MRRRLSIMSFFALFLTLPLSGFSSEGNLEAQAPEREIVGRFHLVIRNVGGNRNHVPEYLQAMDNKLTTVAAFMIAGIHTWFPIPLKGENSDKTLFVGCITNDQIAKLETWIPDLIVNPRNERYQQKLSLEACVEEFDALTDALAKI